MSDIKSQRRNGRGIRIFSNKKYILAGAVSCKKSSRILMAAKNGEVYTLNADEIPETSPGGNMYQVINDFEFEKITNIKSIIASE
jgi:DNA gyrase subunit A